MFRDSNEGSSGEPKVYQDSVFDGLKFKKTSQGSDNFSGLSRGGLIEMGGRFSGQESKDRIRLSMNSKRDVLELRRKLEAELDMVRSLINRIETRKLDNRDVDYTKASIVDNVEKEERTSKENELGKNKGFSSAKSKVFKSCNALLVKLMRHKHGWVFNKPVDAIALGLDDYFEIIKQPMDLGTVKSRLTKFWYKSPMEFAEDVRLTFRNAMTYNSKGQDVHVMADQLSKIFEEKWAPVEAEYTCGLSFGADLDLAKTQKPPQKALDIAMHDTFPVPKKLKKRGLEKREMTYEEKEKLGISLQSLPSEKLEEVVHIIKKRNSSISEDDDEFEVDIDTIDSKTLWELHRFLTDYQRSLSKSKRKDENITPEILKERVVSPLVQLEEPQPDDSKQGAGQSESYIIMDSDDEGSSVGVSAAINMPNC